jgi:hypothetical protein
MFLTISFAIFSLLTIFWLIGILHVTKEGIVEYAEARRRYLKEKNYWSIKAYEDEKEYMPIFLKRQIIRLLFCLAILSTLIHLFLWSI